LFALYGVLEWVFFQGMFAFLSPDIFLHCSMEFLNEWFLRTRCWIAECYLRSNPIVADVLQSPELFSLRESSLMEI
jgi:hypothetical protein